MTSTPPPSPWPAPTLSDAAPLPQPTGTTSEPVIAAPQRSPAAALLTTARRFSSRAERAQHAAEKQEQRIRDDIDDLPAGWFVLHAPDTDDFGGEGHRPDHVAIGPAGVFVVYVEHHAAAKVWVSEHKLTINGRDTDHLRRSRFEARRSSGSLTDACGRDVTVQSVLVLIGAATMQTISRPAEVHVRTEHDLRDWLCHQPQRLDTDSVMSVYEQVRPTIVSPSAGSSGLLE